MGTMCVPSKTLCPTLKGYKWGYSFFPRERLEPRVLPWKQHRRRHSVSFVMYIFGAKFEELCSNISRDTYMYSVFLLFKWNYYFLTSSLSSFG